MAGQPNRTGHVCLPVTSRNDVVMLPFPGRPPAFVVATAGTVVTFMLPERPEAPHVEFARALAREAARYAVDVERAWRGLLALNGAGAPAKRAGRWPA